MLLLAFTSISQLFESSILLSGRVQPSQRRLCQEILSKTDHVQDGNWLGLGQQESGGGSIQVMKAP